MRVVVIREKEHAREIDLGYRKVVKFVDGRGYVLIPESVGKELIGKKVRVILIEEKE